MVPELQCRFDALEKQRDALQNTLCTLSEAQLRWTPNAETWSSQQIVEHLVLSDETLGRAQNAPPGQTEAWLFRLVPRFVRFALIIYALNHDVALPLPSSAVNPQGTTALPILLQRWEEMREEMRSALATMQSHARRYSHPVAGPLTAMQMLALEEVHVAYHTRQMEVLQRKKTFP